jgi:hypothetical protein
LAQLQHAEQHADTWRCQHSTPAAAYTLQQQIISVWIHALGAWCTAWYTTAAGANGRMAIGWMYQAAVVIWLYLPLLWPVQGLGFMMQGSGNLWNGLCLRRQR